MLELDVFGCLCDKFGDEYWSYVLWVMDEEGLITIIHDGEFE